MKNKLTLPARPVLIISYAEMVITPLDMAQPLNAATSPLTPPGGNYTAQQDSYCGLLEMTL